MVSPCSDPWCWDVLQAVLVCMFNSKRGQGNSLALYGGEPCYHGNLSLLASVEILALHLLFWKDFVTNCPVQRQQPPGFAGRVFASLIQEVRGHQ